MGKTPIDPNDALCFGKRRVANRQVDELIGLARGLIADGVLNSAEVEFLYKWLVANIGLIDNPLLHKLYDRVNDVLSDGIVDQQECAELFDTLHRLSSSDFEAGETLKATTLPVDTPPPDIEFQGTSFCFTGTFTFGRRSDCESAVLEKGARIGGLTKKTRFLVIGTYATDSWLHSAFGEKILKAVEYKRNGCPIAIITEEHWRKFL